jgi:hypothetical protein
MKLKYLSLIFALLISVPFSTAKANDNFPIGVKSDFTINNKTGGTWWNMAPANFMAEGRRNIYLENIKKPMHAWFMAFVPGAYSMITTLVNKSYEEQDGGDGEGSLETSKFYFAAIPLALGTLYADRKIESLVITMGEAVGSYFIFSYFNLDRSMRDENINTFYMGVGIYAFFWVVDMIYAPIMSWKYNKELAKLYLADQNDVQTPVQAELKPRAIAADYNPNFNGSASIGPRGNLPNPFMIGIPFSF